MTDAADFRTRYLDHDALTARLRGWAEAHPDLVRLRSLGRTPEGREIALLVVGRDPERVRPTLWVNANQHAIELAGSSVALAFVDDLLALHAGAGPDLPPAVREAVLRARFYVVPRVSPDGAEAVLRQGRFVRSVPRDERLAEGPPRWVTGDVDGDGRVRAMRVRDPAGDFVAHPDHPDLLVMREVGDPGPYWKLYPEGTVTPWDGFTVPAPHFLSDNPVDLNRNFPWTWAPTHEQVGAGRFPGSEPESRALLEFVTRSPEIVAWVDFHCFGGVFIRPLGAAPDSKMDQDDLAAYRLLAAWATEHSGYPTVSGYHEFLYAPDRPIRGDLVDFAYHARGAFAVTVELWDLFHRLGIPKPERFVDYYGFLTRAQLGAFAAWDREHNRGRVVGGWRPFEHPQLGPVEIGGLDPRFGVWNPPPELLGEVCAQQSAVLARLAATLPEVAVREVRVTPLGADLARIEVRVDNLGWLATHGLSSAKALDWNEGLVATLEPGPGLALVDPASARAPLGHLAGWGRGPGSGGNDLAYAGSNGGASAARAVWIVRGRGAALARIASPRTGELAVPIAVG